MLVICINKRNQKVHDQRGLRNLRYEQPEFYFCLLSGYLDILMLLSVIMDRLSVHIQ